MAFFMKMYYIVTCIFALKMLLFRWFYSVYTLKFIYFSYSFLLIFYGLNSIRTLSFSNSCFIGCTLFPLIFIGCKLYLFFFQECTFFPFIFNCISGVTVNMLASSAVGRVFEPWSGQTKDYEIGICCFSTKHAALRRKSNDWLSQNNVSHHDIAEKLLSWH